MVVMEVVMVEVLRIEYKKAVFLLKAAHRSLVDLMIVYYAFMDDMFYTIVNLTQNH